MKRPAEARAAALTGLTPTAVDCLLCAGNNLAKAEDIFARAIKHRPGIRLTIRQRTRVLQQPDEAATQ
jgi:hypothetical protein